jgi:hypothetical protein
MKNVARTSLFGQQFPTLEPGEVMTENNCQLLAADKPATSNQPPATNH